MRTQRQCVECGRIFDLLNPEDADELVYGHDCEETPEESDS